MARRAVALAPWIAPAIAGTEGTVAELPNRPTVEEHRVMGVARRYAVIGKASLETNVWTTTPPTDHPDLLAATEFNPGANASPVKIVATPVRRRASFWPGRARTLSLPGLQIVVRLPPGGTRTVKQRQPLFSCG
jgi:hypothetical protein